MAKALEAMKDVFYEVWVRVGDKGGTVTPPDQKDPMIENRQDALALAARWVSEADEVVVLEKRIVTRMKGTRTDKNGPGIQGQKPPGV